MTNNRRLIEDSLPLEAISYQSAREKHVRHKHISSLHIWWARRPLAAMRAVIFASLIPAPETDEEREHLHQLIGGTYNPQTGKWEGGICDWDNVKNGNAPVIEEAKRLITKHHPDGPPKVLDPFMGGGSTGLEALRLGCEAHGVELNPVAHLIELCTLVYSQKYGQPIPRGEYEARPSTPPQPVVSDPAPSVPPPAASINELDATFDQDVIKLTGRTDNGAWHRAIDVARKLVAAGVWNGRDMIEFDACKLHDKLFGATRVETTNLVEGEDYRFISPRANQHKTDSEQIILPKSTTPGPFSSDQSDEMINPLAEDFRRWGHWVLEQARAEIGHLFEDPEGRTIVGYIWARTAKCPNPACGAEMPMVHHWWLAKKSDRKVAIRPVVDHAHKTLTFDIAENDEIDFDPADGTVRRGIIKCLVCGRTPERNYLKTEGYAGRLGAVPMVVVYDRPDQSGKGYRAVTEFDLKLFEKASALLAERLKRDPDALPDESVPLISGPFNASSYGMDRWGKLFNARQALALITFVDKVRAAYAQIAAQDVDTDYARVVGTLLAFAVDSMANKNSTLAPWVAIGEKAGNTFGRHALAMVWDYAEVNPFRFLAGGWTLVIKHMSHVVEHCTQTGEKPAQLLQGDASRLSTQSNTFNAVITDPPYYNCVPYADLSDFFYVWLKRTLGDLYPDIFSTPLTPKSSEIVEMASVAPNFYGHKNKSFYETQMTKALAEAQRVLKDDGILVLVFAHKSTSAWEALISSVLQAGLVVTAAWPLRTESPGRLNALNTAALSSSVFIVCRKRTADTEGYYDDVLVDLRAHINERLDFFWKHDIRGADLFNIIFASSAMVYSQFSLVRKLTGEVVSVAELLDMTKKMIAEYTVNKVMNKRYRGGVVDAATRFYIMYRWKYATSKITFDDAQGLAQSVGADMDDLVHCLKLLKQRGKNVSLLAPYQRDCFEYTGESCRERLLAPLINVLHRVVLLSRAGNRQTMDDYLAKCVKGREDILCAVAQALVNVLPEGNRERQMMEAFLARRDILPSSSR